MPKDEKKAKLGDRVTVTIKKPPKRRAETAKPEDRRYGPPPFVDEDDLRRVRKATVIHFLNQQSIFSRTNVFFATPKQELKYLHQWSTDPFTFGFLSLDKNFGVRRYSDSTSFVIYRDGWNRHPLPYANADDYGISLKLGAVSKPLVEANPDWVAYEPDDDNEFEVDEWEAAYDSDFTFWIEPNVTWHRNYGFYKTKPARKSTYAVENSGIAFEPFDPFDTTNYKVTEGEFADSEVAAPRLSPSKANDLRLGLIPRRWEYTLEYVGWHYQDVFSPVPESRIWKKDYLYNGELPAITLPYFEYNTPSTYAGINKFPVQTSEWDAGLFSSITSSFDSVETDGLPVGFDNIYLFRKLELSPTPVTAALIDVELPFETGDLDHPGNDRTLFERSDATIDITEKDLAAGDLVGLFSVNGQAFYVYRKTSEVRGASIYSGPYDSIQLDARNFYPPLFDDYINPSWQSRTRDFAYFDPSNVYAHYTE
jgi:hypothetical protein